MREYIAHTLPPWWDGDSRILILGTMPSPKSRQRSMYYGHPQNRFWRTLAAVFAESTPQTPADARAFCKRQHIALWDVLAACSIEGAADASIRDAVANDLRPLLTGAPISAIFCTGAKAHSLYNKHIRPTIGLPATLLPSPSAANRARWPDDALCEAYAQLRPAAHAPVPAPPFAAGVNLFDAARDGHGESLDVLYEDATIRIERIVSWAHPSPASGFYEQEDIEWVSVLQGWATLANEEGEVQHLVAGAHCLIPARKRHRVAATSSPCIWLCAFSKTGQ